MVALHRLLGVVCVLLGTVGEVPVRAFAEPILAGRAVLPADTFAPGPTSGQFILPANGRQPPFVDRQPIQGFSAILPDSGGTFLVISDNGFGSRCWTGGPSSLFQA